MIPTRNLLAFFCLVAAAPLLTNAKPAIKTAYLGGLNVLPFFLGQVSGCNQNFGDDGMPLVMSVQVNSDTLDPGDFRVISRAGVVSTPNCATLRPANEPNELHTILLTGPIADTNDLPDRVEIVGAVEDLDGNSLIGLVSPTVIIGSESGPSLVHAFLFDQPGGPSGSSPRVIQLVWEGGVTGPNNGNVGANQLSAVHIIDCDGNSHSPIGFSDLGDGDNYIEVYVPEDVVADRIEVDAGFFFDPANIPNPATAVQVSSLLPAASATQIMIDTPTAGRNQVDFLGTPGIPHRVFFTTDLKIWNCIGTATADPGSGAFSFQHDRASEPKGFYRSTP